MLSNSSTSKNRADLIFYKQNMTGIRYYLDTAQSDAMTVSSAGRRSSRPWANARRLPKQI